MRSGCGSPGRYASSVTLQPNERQATNDKRRKHEYRIPNHFSEGYPQVHGPRITHGIMTPAAIRFRLIFRVPLSGAEACKKAIFAAGAGRYPGPGQYTECCFSSTGTGQFRPGDTANPHIGSVGKIEEVSEMRIETVAHPYEEPAYEVIKLEDF
ncbi:hypothetical protein J7T55_004258 [Diaporthe amygdali]|uniref:uncharacterized protein n=1 Tax=Phomopsis amygdali TaxID=1214568 RepID=UPI0022FE2FE0|nr:uncharacterized protein J7T55_004258 [Diaporthe amygdali]KAJ0100747.1 hypothetical protein J7T55_004258 [Diaporthe amygdali]